MQGVGRESPRATRVHSSLSTCEQSGRGTESGRAQHLWRKGDTWQVERYTASSCLTVRMLRFFTLGLGLVLVRAQDANCGRDLVSISTRLNALCCGSDSTACTGVSAPRGCSAACAGLWNPFYSRCGQFVDASLPDLASFASRCQATASTAPAGPEVTDAAFDPDWSDGCGGVFGKQPVALRCVVLGWLCLCSSRRCAGNYAWGERPGIGYCGPDCGEGAWDFECFDAYFDNPRESLPLTSVCSKKSAGTCSAAGVSCPGPGCKQLAVSTYEDPVPTTLAIRNMGGHAWAWVPAPYNVYAIFVCRICM